MRQINLRVPEELLARIDAAAGDVPRERWLRRTVEAALPPVEPVIPLPPDAAVEQVPGEVKEPPTREPSDSGLRTPGGDRSAAPAEQPYRSSSFAKRDVRPVPKRGA